MDLPGTSTGAADNRSDWQHPRPRRDVKAGFSGVKGRKSKARATSDGSYYEVKGRAVPRGPSLRTVMLTVRCMGLFDLLEKWPLIRQMRHRADGTGRESMSERTRA